MSDNVQRFCRLGQEHLTRHEPEEAFVWYGRALSEDPDSVEALCGRGQAAYDLGRLQRADRDFRRAVQLARARWEQASAAPSDMPAASTDYVRALHGWGMVLFWTRKYEKAQRVLERVLQLTPTDPNDVRFLIGECCLRGSDIDRAVAIWQSAPDDPDALYNLGLAYFYRGEFVRSVSALRQAIFGNLFTVARIVDAHVLSDVPSTAGTHCRTDLQCEHAAGHYMDRCGDLWKGRPILVRWLRGIYEHPTVQAELKTHIAHMRTLADPELSPGERARLEGENTVLRSEVRLAATDGDVARDLCESLFRIS